MSRRKPLRSKMSCSTWGDVERGMEQTALFGVLEAVIWHRGFEHAVGDSDGLERLGAGVGGREGDMAGGMPVLGEEDVVEFACEGVNGGNDLIATGDGEDDTPFPATCRAEVVLQRSMIRSGRPAWSEGYQGADRWRPCVEG